MSVFASGALLRDAEWIKVFWGEYTDWGNNYCTNKNFLLFPNDLDLGTFILWIARWIA